MNILILTGKFGMGHFSAALAIQEKILLEHPTYNVKVLDFIEYMFPNTEKYIYGAFNMMVDRCHTVYNFLGNISSRHRNAPLKKVVVKKIDKLLKDNKIDMVISTLPICSQYISSYKKICNSDIILNTFVTDICIREEWISTNTNLYFVPSYKTRDYLISKGVELEKIIVSGIPTKVSFTAPKRRKKEKRILIMGGGLGLIPCADDFLESLSIVSDIKVTIIVGNNVKMFQKINNKYANIEVIGFTNEVYKYMREADIVITKAGGITLFEAIQTETPLFIIKPFLLQEVGNAKFIQDKQIGEVVWQKREALALDVISLLNNEEKLAGIRHNMRILKENFDKTSYLINATPKRRKVC